MNLNNLIPDTVILRLDRVVGLNKRGEELWTLSVSEVTETWYGQWTMLLGDDHLEIDRRGIIEFRGASGVVMHALVREVRYEK